MLHDYPFTSHYLEVPGGRLHYLDEGEGPAIIMVHGNPTWSYFYRNLVRRLSSRYRVVVPDHIGCGLSDKPADYPYLLENHIENLRLLFHSLKISSTSLVVHDWGGAIGMGFAGKYSQCIDSVVVLNTAAFRSRRIPFRIRICRWSGIGEFLVRGLNGFARSATFMAVTRRMEKETVADYLAPYDSWENRIAIFEFVRDIPLEPKHRSYKTLTEVEMGLDTLKQRAIPMFILWGGKDFCFNDHFYREWRKRFPEAEYSYLEDAGHYVLEDGRDEAGRLIEGFFTKTIGT